MFVSVTRLKLKSRLAVPLFYFHAIGSMIQVKKTKGLLYSSTRNIGKLSHYTLTVWESKENMLAYRNNGRHQKAMKATGKIAEAAQSANFETDKIPTWDEALEFLKAGKNKEFSKR